MIRSPWAGHYRLSAISESKRADCWAALRHLECFYPDFEKWYHLKVMAGLRDGTREVFIACPGDRLAGIAIAKREHAETKLCTLFIVPEFRNSRIGANLAARAFEWLGNERPLFTVPEERMNEFGRLVSAWQFQFVQNAANSYRSGKVEYVFNGRLINPS